MIKAEDYDQEFKNKVNRKILEDFRNNKKELLKQDNIQKKEFVEQGKKDIEELENLKNLEKPEGIQLIKKSKQLSNGYDENLYDNINEEKDDNEINSTNTLNNNVNNENSDDEIIK